MEKCRSASTLLHFLQQNGLFINILYNHFRDWKYLLKSDEEMLSNAWKWREMVNFMPGIPGCEAVEKPVECVNNYPHILCFL